MNDARFKRALKVTTGVHIAVVVALALAPLIMNLLRPRKRPELITFIDLIQAPPSLPAPVPEVVEPEPEPEPETVVPEPRPRPRPERPRIRVNTNRIVRRAEAPPRRPQQPALTPEQIRRLLAQGITATSPAGSMGGGDPGALAAYYAHVRDTMYGAWRQPSGIGAAGTSADVVVRVQRNGQVASRRMSRGSGSAAFDATVMTAVQSVSRLRPLPAGVQGPHLDITVQFELQGL